MITVTYLGESYTCSKAIKGTDYIHLLDGDGCMVVAFDGITDFTGFTIEGGSWTTPTPNNDCYLAVIGDDGVVRVGGHKCCDIGKLDITWSYGTAGSVKMPNSRGVYLLRLSSRHTWILYYDGYSEACGTKSYRNATMYYRLFVNGSRVIKIYQNSAEAPDVETEYTSGTIYYCKIADAPY